MTLYQYITAPTVACNVILCNYSCVNAFSVCKPFKYRFVFVELLCSLLTLQIYGFILIYMLIER
uniref:Uncharacterized protein n=1 Tax=Myoviridae sp. ctPoO4 TaxID=2827685 RepID=A0A8S5SMG9_9CAUD|nr:MAG TPA: hypothetical protein [Myoviridae sp. ctPoO4]